MATYLDRILEAHRSAARADPRSLSELSARARSCEPPRGFLEGLRQASQRGDPVAVIAEIKRRSPSKGDMAVDIDVAKIARAYEAGGAACISVLTDHRFFGGSPDDLDQARSASRLPILRKDFTVHAADVYDARLMGADCVLLIVAALGESELVELHALACELGLDALVEVHDEAELDRAIGMGATLVGVNQRDLVTFDVDPRRAIELASKMPAGIVTVAESGITSAKDCVPLAVAGFDAVLVGEALVTHPDPTRAVRAMRAATG